MDIISVAQRRYSTKEFDSTKSIDPQSMEQIRLLLQLSPSSTNIQPWHFIVATSAQGKARIAKATQGFYAFNEQKVLNASAVVVFCSRTAADEDFMNHLSDKEQLDGRYANDEFRAQNHAGRAAFANMHLFDLKDQQHWFDKQLYLNLGNFLLGVAALGFDALPMEGFDAKSLAEEFHLFEKGFTPSVLVAVGYHTATDFNLTLPKSRLSADEIIEQI